jgi:WD40 repeat protein
MISTLTGSSAGPIAGYVATGKSSSRYLNVSSSRKNALAIQPIATQPTDSSSTIYAVSFSANYLAAASDDAAGLKFYSRAGSTFTAESVPSNIDCGYGDCSISADGLYVAAGSSTAGGDVWHNASGTLTNLSIGTTGSNSRACAMSSDGKYAAFLSSTSGSVLRIKERSGSGATATYADMTLASQPTSGATSGTTLAGLSFSPDNTYLAVSPPNAANQTVYKLNTGTGIYEKLASPFSGTAPDASVRGCRFSAQGDMLAICTSSNTFMYSRSADTFTYEATLTGGDRGGFHPSGNYYIDGSGKIFKKNSASSWTNIQTVTAGECAAFSPAI